MRTKPTESEMKTVLSLARDATREPNTTFVWDMFDWLRDGDASALRVIRALQSYARGEGSDGEPLIADVAFRFSDDERCVVEGSVWLHIGRSATRTRPAVDWGYLPFRACVLTGVPAPWTCPHCGQTAVMDLARALWDGEFGDGDDT